MAFGHQRLNLRLALIDRLIGTAVFSDRRVHDVRGMQKRRALKADIDERSLHARQDPRDAALIDVADQPATIGAFEKDLLQDAVLDERRARFARTDVDEDFRAHCSNGSALLRTPFASARPGQPISRSSCAVSNNGSPMIPE